MFEEIENITVHDQITSTAQRLMNCMRLCHTWDPDRSGRELVIVIPRNEDNASTSGQQGLDEMPKCEYLAIGIFERMMQALVRISDQIEILRPAKGQKF